MSELRNKRGFICDMDGVIYHGNILLEGVTEFYDWLIKEKKEFIFLTNSSERSPRELKQKLSRMGLDVGEDHFYTSALATADFLKSQCPGGSVYVIGEPGLSNALYDAGFTMNNVNPDYVVVGESRSLNYEMIERATLLVRKGAKLIGLSLDRSGTRSPMIPLFHSLEEITEDGTADDFLLYVGSDFDANTFAVRHGGDTLIAEYADRVNSGSRTILSIGGKRRVGRLRIRGDGVAVEGSFFTFEECERLPLFVIARIKKILKGRN